MIKFNESALVNYMRAKLLKIFYFCVEEFVSEVFCSQKMLLRRREDTTSIKLSRTVLNPGFFFFFIKMKCYHMTKKQLKPTLKAKSIIAI